MENVKKVVTKNSKKGAFVSSIVLTVFSTIIFAFAVYLFVGVYNMLHVDEIEEVTEEVVGERFGLLIFVTILLPVYFIAAVIDIIFAASCLAPSILTIKSDKKVWGIIATCLNGLYIVSLIVGTAILVA